MMTTSDQGQLAGSVNGTAGRGRFGSVFSELYASSAWLTVTGILMLIDTGIALIGLMFYPTMTTSPPPCPKPLKFGISTSIFSFTIAYIIGRLVKTRRFAAILGKVMA